MNKDLIEKVEQWFIDRNLHTGDPLKQWEKLVEEFGELVKGKNKNDIDMIKDSIGDMLVVMIGISLQKKVQLYDYKSLMDLDDVDDETQPLMFRIIMLNESLTNKCLPSWYVTTSLTLIIQTLEHVSMSYNTTLDECLQLAYDEIKHRKGKLINGVFVKESDLNE